MEKLAIVTTHPIQYYAPIFRLLTKEGKVGVKVFYTYEKVEEVYDVGFGKSFSWDIPLLDGYDYTFVSNNGNIKKSFWDVSNPTLNKEIESWGANAVLVFGWNYKSHLNVLRYFKGKIPVLFRGDSTLLDVKIGIKNILRKIFLMWVYKHIDYALYVGTANKKYYQYCGLKDSQLVFAPHAIDNERFSKLTEEQLTFIKQTHLALGINEQDIVLLYSAKFQSVKNPSLLIKAFKKISNPNVKLIMVGNGELENELRNLSNDDERISFLPFQNQSMMPAVYRLADLYVLPSISETWGLAVNEAMACGRAVIVSNKCGCAEDLVKDGINGYICESENQHDLVRKLNTMIENEEKIIKMGEVSSKKIQNWSFEAVVNAINNTIIL